MPSGVHTYAGYELVECTEEFEYHEFYTYVNGTLISHVRKRRGIETRTYEATLTDAIPGAPSEYNYEQGYPGAVMNLSEPWRLQSVEYTKSLSVPMSKICRETWARRGQWEVDYDYMDSSSN